MEDDVDLKMDLETLEMDLGAEYESTHATEADMTGLFDEDLSADGTARVGDIKDVPIGNATHKLEPSIKKF